MSMRDSHQETSRDVADDSIKLAQSSLFQYQEGEQVRIPDQDIKPSIETLAASCSAIEEPEAHPLSLHLTIFAISLHLIFILNTIGFAQQDEILDLFPACGSNETDLRYLPSILRPVFSYEFSILGNTCLIAAYLYCVIELFWEGRWKHDYLPWVCIAGFIGLALGSAFVHQPAWLFLGVLFTVLDIGMVSSLVVDFISS